jgi:hypothetical protein
MITEKDFENLKIGSEIVEKILNDNDKGELYNLNEMLWKPYYDIEQRRDKRVFYNHISNLFLNVLLNRLDEWGTRGEKVAMDSRKIIVEIRKKIDE